MRSRLTLFSAALWLLTPEALAADGPCTQQQLMSVATATDPTSEVLGMMGSAPECAACFMGCASKTGAEQTACGSACGPAGIPPKCEDSPDDVVNAASDGLLPNCEAGKALCSVDPRIPLGCPLSCGMCKPEKPECKDSPDEVVNAVSGVHPPGAFCFFMGCEVGLRGVTTGGLLPNCEAGKALCATDPRIPAGCPLTCGVCKPECKDSADDVVNAASGMPVLLVPSRGHGLVVLCVQVACSPTARLARRCAARTHASRLVVL
jgi:hypothetical protein